MTPAGYAREALERAEKSPTGVGCTEPRGESAFEGPAVGGALIDVVAHVAEAEEALSFGAGSVAVSPDAVTEVGVGSSGATSGDVPQFAVVHEGLFPADPGHDDLLSSSRGPVGSDSSGIIEKILAIHHNDPDPTSQHYYCDPADCDRAGEGELRDWCADCDKPWPCPTVRALSDALEVEA